jgi:alanine racemase
MMAVVDAAYLRPVWMEVNLDHLAFNLRQVRRFVGSGVKVMAVIKGNAYGAGIEGIIDTLLAGGVDMLGTGILDEALLVRSLDVRTPILVFGYTPFACSELLVKNEIIQTVYSYEQAAALSAAAAGLGRIARIHLEIDTGMGRLGFLPYDAALREIKAIAALPHLQIDGIYTHCPYTNEREGPGREFTKRQFAEFTRFARRLAAAGVPVPLLHACNSLGILHYPEMHMNMVRAGIILYGSYPGFQQVLPQKPVMALKTRVGSVKYVPAGHNIGYGHTFTAPQDMLVAVLPVGYADGYSRALSNKAHVLIHGRRVPVIGTICMDQCMVDVTTLREKCRIGDEAVLIGRQGEEEITVEELSMLGCGYINYEYLVGISHRVPRIYTGRQGAVSGEPGK